MGFLDAVEEIELRFKFFEARHFVPLVKPVLGQRLAGAFVTVHCHLRRVMAASGIHFLHRTRSRKLNCDA